jgi:membrane-anchored mycosin MYCP
VGVRSVSRRVTPGWVRLAVICLVAVGFQPLAAAPAAAAPCAEPGRSLAPVPWPQQMLDFERAWPLTRGGNVKVAVLDSGVDANHPQLRPRVAAGTDLIDPPTAGRADCAGRGTQVAGIVAAQPEQGVGFRGVAPQATIVPVRVSDDETGGPSAGAAGLAAGIRFAVGSGARVVLVSFAIFTADPAVEAEVAAAVAADVLIVATVGEDGGQGGADRIPYPAAYPGVIGVGAVGENTLAWNDNGTRAVDLVAPGVRVVSTQRGAGLVLADGTGHAAAFVAGAAALVRGRWPTMRVPEVTRRLTATAAPAPGGADTARYGSGIVSPYAAVADQLAAGPPGSLPGLRADTGEDRDRAATWASSATLAVLLAAVAVLVALAFVGVAAALPRGRRGRWRPRVAPRPVQRSEDEEPAPPVRLFADREL